MPLVFVSIPPQAYFAETIGGDRINVEVLVKPGQDPHMFEPTPKQIARLTGASLFFRIGIDIENVLVPRIESMMNSLTIVDCTNGILLREIQIDEHEHDGGKDPHIWLSVRNASRIAEVILYALIDMDPAGKQYFTERYNGLLGELESLYAKNVKIFAPVKDKTMFVFHPAFGYFADEYGLTQVAVEREGSEPSARQLAQFIEHAKEHKARVIFVQPQFSSKSAEAVAQAIDGKVVPIDPLAYDYIENLERMARAVAEGIE